MARYEAQVAEIADELATRAAGIGVVEHPVSEHGAVFSALTKVLPASATWAPLTVELLASPPTGLWVARVGEGDVAALEALNRARDAIARQAWLLLVVDRRQHERLRASAPDVLAAPAFVLRLAFERDPDVDPEAARGELIARYVETFGHLDLRGLARSEGEDVAFSVSDVYQDLECEPDGAPIELPAIGGHVSTPRRRTEPIIARLRGAATPRREVVLGSPGSGKSFFLRWLALNPAQLGATDAVAVLLPIAALGRPVGPTGLDDRVVDELLESAPRAAHALEAWARAGRLCWLFDGLDETGDAASRQVMVRALQAFAARWSGCDVVVTSRVAGYAEAPLSAPFRGSRLAPFSDEAIARFLERWLTLYARQARGTSAVVEGEARAQAAKLSADILAGERLRALAESPLLLTLIAILHRTGMRLPRSRVELYEHAVRVLVERWNRARTTSRADGAAPIGMADALRLLGPIALASIQRSDRGQVSEDELRAALARRVGRAPLPLATVDEAVQLFARTLGLLVETAPGRFGFLHLTLAEYLAARELVRTGELEAVVADPRRVFRPEWREVMLLAAGELGVVRADDERLARMVASIVAAVRPRKARAQDVMGLLFGLLEDDPSLSEASGAALVEVAVPLAAMEGSPRAARWVERLVDEGRFSERARRSLRAVAAAPTSADWTGGHIGPEVKFNLGAWLIAHVLASVDGSGLVTAALRAGRSVRTGVGWLFYDELVLVLPVSLARDPWIDGRPLGAVVVEPVTELPRHVFLLPGRRCFASNAAAALRIDGADVADAVRACAMTSSPVMAEVALTLVEVSPEAAAELRRFRAPPWPGVDDTP